MKRILKLISAVILLATVLSSFTSCITLARYIISTYNEKKEATERQELTDDSILTSSYAELPLNDYVIKTVDYSQITISRAELEVLIEEDLLLLLKENGISLPEYGYADSEYNEFVIKFTDYESLDAFRTAKYEEHSMELAYSRYVLTLEVHPPKEGDYHRDNLIIEFLFKDLGLQLTFGEYKERIGADMNISYIAPDIADSERSVSEERLEAIIGESDLTGSFAVIEVSDELILEVERMMVREELVRRVTFVD